MPLRHTDVTQVRRSHPTTQQMPLQCSARTTSNVSVFFFQAEDGIRDLTVTGVQTCALPISSPGMITIAPPTPKRPDTTPATRPISATSAHVIARLLVQVVFPPPPNHLRPEIGRASWRERV